MRKVKKTLKWEEFKERFKNLFTQKCVRCGASTIGPDTGNGRTSIAVNLKDHGWKYNEFVCPKCADIITDGVKMSDYSHGTFFIRYREFDSLKTCQVKETSLDKAESFVYGVITGGGTLVSIIFGIKMTVQFGMLIDTNPLPDGWENSRPIEKDEEITNKLRKVAGE